MGSPTCKKLFPHQDSESLNVFYGNPMGRNGQVSPKWYAANIVKWTPPYPIWFSVNTKQQLKTLSIHKKCVPVFDAAFKAVLAHFGLAKIHELRLDISGGAYNYRLERGGSNLSVHAWGCAIDMDPVHNPFPKKWKTGMIDPTFAQIMEDNGFWWRGSDGDIDPMHFQNCWRGQ